MPRIIETTVYKFDELSDKAKEKARTWYREASAGDTYFAESIIEDAAEIAELFGLSFRKVPIKLMSGKTRTEPAVNWSGFSSQGDGASFEGTYHGKEGGLAAVKSHAPTDEKLHAIVAALESAQGELIGKIAGTITTSGNYSHAYSMRFEFELDESDSEQEISAETVKAMEEAFRDYANWIYKNLEAEYEYINSDESVDETIRANDYEFEAKWESSMTDSLFPLFHGFEIRETAGGFFLVDRATFNNWGNVCELRPLADRQAAIDYAFACDQFKRGRRMTLN